MKLDPIWTTAPQAPVEIVAYNTTWPKKFEEERSNLEQILSQWLVGSIEHVGSTAIPNMVAKPVIDLMAPVASLEESRPSISVLSEAGYLYCPYKAEVMHWFCKPSPSHRTHHLHLIPFESPLWFDRLRFRDRLQQNQALAEEYADLKRELARRHRNDREAYTEGKSDFVRYVLSGGDD